jgi:hypothetical protein
MNGRRHQPPRRDAAIAAAKGKGWPPGQLALSPWPQRSMGKPGDFSIEVDMVLIYLFTGTKKEPCSPNKHISKPNPKIFND